MGSARLRAAGEINRRNPACQMALVKMALAHARRTSLDDARYVTYKLLTLEVRQTIVFESWLNNLRDRSAAKRIVRRLARVAIGNFGDVRCFDGIGEMRLDVGPGYRLYFVRGGSVVVIMLCGGDKASQRRDIATAIAMAREF